ncbi:imelysin family protein [Marinospirillum perlucidum]|uniref:imelysin family protein n=1 Tax=Marinospirillum perlucidum TaxID=1982602 RepID=UPI000DF1465F|nr:imelysin family protein [Marinospirillum perlucidum]
MLNKTSLAGLLLPLAVLATPVLAEPSAEDWQTYNRAAVEQQILPGYNRLVNKLDSLHQQITNHCDQGNQLAQVKSTYREAMDAWQAIQHVQFGPITLFMRNYAIQYWPDKRGTGARQIRQALNQSDQNYDADYFREASVSLQGFPALERVVFGNEADNRFQPGQNHCRFAQGLSQHLLGTARELEQEWQNQEKQRLLNPESSQYFASHAAAAVPLMKSLAEPLLIIEDYKLEYVLGDSPEEARWQRSESWRSGQTLSNIQTNLASLQELYSGLEPISVKSLLTAEGEGGFAESVDQEFDRIQAQVASLSEPEAAEIDPQLDRQLRELETAISDLYEQLELAMGVLNIHLGFNSRDGD